jgi:hypothetical protein
MDAREAFILSIAALVRQSVALNEAALAGNFQEARVCAQSLLAMAQAAGHADLGEVVADVLIRLGPIGTCPKGGYGEGLLRIAHEIDDIAFPPRR